MAFRRGIYIVPTHRWYIERSVWLIAGCVLLVSTTLAALIDPLWVLLVIATALASITVSLTGFCIVGNILYRLGFTPMLGRADAGRWCGSRARAFASWRTACTGGAPSHDSDRRSRLVNQFPPRTQRSEPDPTSVGQQPRCGCYEELETAD
jgi:hypothetical protein